MKTVLKKKLARLDLIIVSHILTTGPALELEEFLKDKVRNLLFIGHPFGFRKDTRSFFRSYTNKKLNQERFAISWKIPQILIFFKEAIYTFVWVSGQNKTYDLYIGSDNFSAYLGIILKKLGKVKEVILYTIDYVPNRFESPLLNSLYRYFDKTCLKECKVVWNVSDKIVEARQKYENIGREDSVPQITVPLGVWYSRIPKVPFKDREKCTLVFLGTVLEKQGLDIVVKALPEISKKIPGVRLTLIGEGPYLITIKNLARKYKVEKLITFAGYVESHEEVERILSKSTIGIATYKPDPESFTFFADPGKIKNYLAAGLPVVLTDVPAIAIELEKQNCGFVCKYSSDDFSRKIIDNLSDLKKLSKFSQNAVNYARKFDWNNVYEEAFTYSLD